MQIYPEAPLGVFRGIKFEPILFIYGELNPEQYLEEMLQ